MLLPNIDSPLQPANHNKLKIRRARTKGFTLFELIIVLSILALGVLVTPHLEEALKGIRAKATLIQILQDLYRTRNAAIRSGEIVTLCSSKDGKTCIDYKKKPEEKFWESGWIMFKEKDHNPPVIMLSRPALKNGDSIKFRRSSSNTKLQYSHLGITEDSVGGSFIYCFKNKKMYHKSVILDLHGRAQLGDAIAKDGC